MISSFRPQADGIPVIDKAPDAVLDYSVDWAAPERPWLATGETITSYAVTVEEGLTKNSDGKSPADAATQVLVWLAGGTIDTIYLVTVEIVTNQGRTDSRSFRVHILLR